MAARASPPSVPAKDVAIEDAVRAALVGGRPSLGEILSLWPSEHRRRVVLRARLGADGAISVGACRREHAFARESLDVVREVRRIRDDIPVVLELDDVGSVVVSLRALGVGA